MGRHLVPCVFLKSYPRRWNPIITPGCRPNGEGCRWVAPQVWAAVQDRIIKTLISVEAAVVRLALARRIRRGIATHDGGI